MSDAVLLGEPTSVDQFSLCFHVSQSKSDVDPRPGGWFDLCEYVVSIQWDNRLTGTSLSILADTQAKFEELVIDRSEPRFSAGEHFLDVTFRCFQIGVWITLFCSYPGGPIRKPPCGVGS